MGHMGPQTRNASGTATEERTPTPAWAILRLAVGEGPLALPLRATTRDPPARLLRVGSTRALSQGLPGGGRPYVSGCCRLTGVVRSEVSNLLYLHR